MESGQKARTMPKLHEPEVEVVKDVQGPGGGSVMALVRLRQSMDVKVSGSTTGVFVCFVLAGFNITVTRINSRYTEND